MIALTNSKKWSVIALAVAIIAPIAYLVSTGQMSLSGLRSDILGSNATCTEASLKKDTPNYRKNIAQRSSMSGEVTLVQAKIASLNIEITGLQTKITTLSSENNGYQNQISALNAYINANCKNPKGAQVTTCNQKKKQVQDLQAKINNNLKKITDTNNQIVNKQNTVAINQAKITKLLEQIRQLNVKIYAYESCKLELVTKPIVFGNIMSGEMQIMSGEASASPCQTKIVSGEVMLTNVLIQAPYVSNGVMSGEVMSGEIKPILRVNMENVVFSVKPSNPDNFNIKSWSMRVDNDRVDCKVKKVSASPVELKITCPFAQSATNTSTIEPGAARTFGLIAKINSIDAPITVETKFTSMNYNGGRNDVDDRTVSNILVHTGTPVNLASVSIDKEKNVAHILYCKNSDACAQLYDDKNTLLHSKDLFCPKVWDTAVSLVDMPLLKANMKVRLKNGNENVWSNEAIVADEHPDICVIAPDLCNTVCGNNKKEGAEQCDDGNTTNGDGCSDKCTLETSSMYLPFANKLANLWIIENHSADPENYRFDESLTRYDAVRATAMTLGGILENESSYICTGVFTDIGKTIPTCRVAELAQKAWLIALSPVFRPDSKLSKYEAIVFALHGAGIMPEGNFSIGEILNLAVESKLIKQTQWFAASSVVSRWEFYEYLAHAIDASNPENPICSSHPELCAPVCWNTIKEGAEQCDDGNKVDSDNCSNTCQVNTPTTASLTINGSHNVTLNVGDQLNYVWTGTNGDSFSSNYTGSPSYCTSSNTWVATNASGTWVWPVPNWQAGCTYTINYVVKKTAVGNEVAKTATDTVTVKIANATTTTSCTDTDGGMNLFTKGTATNNAAVIPAGRTKSATDVCTKQVGQSFQQVATCTGTGCFVEEAVCLSGAEAGFVGQGGSGQADHACPNGCSDGACIQSTSTTATAVSNAAGTIATITNGGSGYTTAPVVTVSGGTCTTRPVAIATVSSGVVSSVVLVGGMCTSAPTITIAAPWVIPTPVVLNQPTFVAANSTISQYILSNGTSKANFNVTAKWSGTAIIKQLKFKASNPDAIGTIKIGNVTASFIAGVANMTGLNIPVQGDTVQWQNLEAVLTYVIVGSGGVDSGTKVDTVLTEIVYDSSDFSQQKLSTSVGTPKMVLVASRPTFIPQQPTSSRLLLGTQIEIIDVTVAAHPAGGDVTLFALPITLGNQNAHINNAANSIRVRADGVLIDTTSDAFADIASNGSTGTIIRFPNGNVIPAGAIRKFQIYVTLSSLLPNASIFASIPGGSGVGLSWSDMTGVLQTDANYAYGSEVISVLSTIKN